MLPLAMAGTFFLLNFIQGISEFLPISSSGHLVVTEWIYGITEHGIEAFLHLPTAITIAIIFWQSYILILKRRSLWPLIIVAILPAGIVGFLFGDYIDAIFYSPIVVAINQIIWGLLFIIVAHYQNQKSNTKKWDEMSTTDALFIGGAQVLALIPGTSRSGVTTLAGIARGIAPSESAKFSFIAGFPLILAASLVGFLKVLKGGELLTTLPLGILLGGMLLSLVVSIFCVKIFTSRHTTTVLTMSGVYRVILGFLIISWLS